MNKEYGAFIPLEEYKELLLAKECLEQMSVDLDALSKEAKEFHDELVNVECELKELLLILTKGKNKPKYLGDFESYDIADSDTIADYLNKNYVTEDNKLFFRKILHEEKENKEEGTKSE